MHTTSIRRIRKTHPPRAFVSHGTFASFSFAILLKPFYLLGGFVLDGVDFVWYVPGQKDADGKATVIARPRSQPDAGTTLCDGKTAGETFRTPGISALSHTFNTIVLCGELFDPKTALQTVAGMTSSKPGRDGKVSDSLGNYRSLAGLFTHEVFHLIGPQCTCQSTPYPSLAGRPENS